MFREIALGQYHPVDSAVHKLDPRTKLLGTMVLIASLFITDNIRGYVIATAVLAVAIRLTKVPARFILRGLKAIMILLLTSVSPNLFLMDGCMLVKFWIFKITFEDMHVVFLMDLRLIYLVIGLSVMVLTTAPNQLIDSLEKGLGFPERFRMPIHEVVVVMSVALKFIPVLAEEIDKTMKAQMVRGVGFETGSLIQKTRAITPLLVSLFISAFRRTTDLAMAMRARCYRDGGDRVKMKSLQYRQADHDAYMIYALYFMVIVVSRAYL